MTDLFAAQGIVLAIILLLLSGTSLAVGQSAVLLANRVPPGRFILALLAGGFVFSLGALFWSASIQVTLNLIYGQNVPLDTTFFLVAISHVPYLLGFLVFLPYLGHIWYAFLRLLAFFVLMVLVGVFYDLTFTQSLLSCGAGWLMIELLSRLPILDRSAWQNVLTRQKDHPRALHTADELADELVAQIIAPTTPPPPPAGKAEE